MFVGKVLDMITLFLLNNQHHTNIINVITDDIIYYTIHKLEIELDD
jgi:hypothetical protein